MCYITFGIDRDDESVKIDSCLLKNCIPLILRCSQDPRQSSSLAEREQRTTLQPGSHVHQFFGIAASSAHLPILSPLAAGIRSDPAYHQNNLVNNGSRIFSKIFFTEIKKSSFSSLSCIPMCSHRLLVDG